MNINEVGFGSDLMNITRNVPSKRMFNRIYEWIPTKDILGISNGNPIISVGYNGFALMTIRRDVIERIPFESDSLYENTPVKTGGAVDTHFCFSCNKNTIPVKTDTRVVMRHLRTSGKMRVEKAKPFCLWWKRDGTRKVYDVKY